MKCERCPRSAEYQVGIVQMRRWSGEGYLCHRHLLEFAEGNNVVVDNLVVDKSTVAGSLLRFELTMVAIALAGEGHKVVLQQVNGRKTVSIGASHVEINVLIQELNQLSQGATIDCTTCDATLRVIETFGGVLEDVAIVGLQPVPRAKLRMLIDEERLDVDIGTMNAISIAMAHEAPILAKAGLVSTRQQRHRACPGVGTRLW